MDEADLSFFGSKKKPKHDKADATTSSNLDSGSFKENSGQKEDIVSRPTDDDTYNCNNPNIGIALIFNHEYIKDQKKRTGTKKDRDDMENVLLKYGFDVRVYDDLTFEDVSETLKKTAKLDHSQNDCLVVVVMSHGKEGKVYAKDMAYPVERLWNPFLGENCKTLVNKPKLFFIQACRGEEVENPVVYQATFATMSRNISNTQVDSQPIVVSYAIPSTADLLVMYSTFENFYSFRNVEDGSWFIQALCDVLHEAATQEGSSAQGAELLSLLTKVNRIVAYEFQSNTKQEMFNQKKEMPNFMSTLTKTFYLKMKK